MGFGKRVLLAGLREDNAIAALLMGRDAGPITGSDFLMDGGVTASWWFGGLAPA